ncbi:ABC transporter ATP-binding protein [Thermococcus sp. 21S9]|uniref:ABC transporter ATP-binding protein n=1 Tax=Thermococcus sp. 21S9 TaxID=1638223 RepID=UPI00143BFC3C|nr:ABC transporter ATP-binding protein [Thermococcus sp. 21S9]NJE55183.1 ABC transporter ATP-binding protein [Thermococcus sp. 21S9]
MIVVENLVKVYKDVRALDGLTLKVPNGVVYGFLGPNGAGKSTTILSLLGLVFPQEGRIELLGEEVFRNGKFDEGKLVKAKARIGYMPEHATLWEFLTPMQTLDIIGKAFKIPKVEREKRSEELLKLVNLWEVRNKKVGKFSKGMRQRLLLAQALINDPELLILDEPMTGLDPTGIAEFKEIIKEQRKAGKTVFFSSHILAHVEEVCDTVGVIVKGRLVLEDSIENIKREFLRKAGYTIIIETNRPVDWSSAPWNVTPLGENKYRVVASEDIREELHDYVASQGAKILTMQVKEPSLEEIFLTLVK